MTDRTQQALQNLIAIIRDRRLGYQEDELHMPPEDAIADALRVLRDEFGTDPEEVVWPDDQDILGIDVTMEEDN